MSKITGKTTEPIYKGFGRYLLPGIVLEATCPSCGQKVRRDFEERGVSIVSKAADFTCGTCGDTWRVRFTVQIELEIKDE